MSDVREVYEMVTKQKPPAPGALQRQQKRQVRAARNKKFGAFAVAAAIGTLAVVVVLANRPESASTGPADASTTPNPADAAARDAALRFLGATGAFDARNAMMYVASDADLSGMIDPRVPANLKGLALDLSWYRASGYHETITSCDASTLDATTSVVCRFDFNGLRSDEIGRGPFSGSEYLLEVQDGEIVSASVSTDVTNFSPQMWEPFAKWLSKTYPDDVAVMYTDDTLTNYRLGERSNQLWEQRTKEYVEVVNQRTAGP